MRFGKKKSKINAFFFKTQLYCDKHCKKKTVFSFKLILRENK